MSERDARPGEESLPDGRGSDRGGSDRGGADRDGSEPSETAAAQAPGGAARAARPFERGTFGWLVALLGWTTLMAFYQLEGGAGLAPVECWVAQTAREMYEGADLHSYIIPRFCGEVRMQKSPGPYWTACLISGLRGSPVDELSVRIPNAVSALLMVATVFWLARRIAGDRAAIFAGFACASSGMLLAWSHNGASDLPVATLMTISLACLWIGSECEPPGGKRVALWLLGYFVAGLAMLYKLPMPLACIGVPAFLYVLLLNRWKIFASAWHLLGLLLFLLPWLPWVIASLMIEDVAIQKWRVEYFDRLTGELPNVEGEQQWFFYLLYIGVALIMAAPYSLSVVQAVARSFRKEDGVDRRGAAFVAIWFLGLLAFFTLAAGKETRYFLPAMPPLFVLLGRELAAFFDPRRRRAPRLDRLGFGAVLVLTPAGLAGLALLLGEWHEKNALEDVFAWSELWPAMAATGLAFGVGAITAAWLYVQRREHAAFGALVCGMWLSWLIVWPALMPRLVSQAPFKDFARQLRERLTDEQRAALRQVAHQDPRIIWYSDVRFPRVVDQLELLAQQDGRRDAERELRIVGKAIVDRLEGDDLALLVSSPRDYAQFHGIAPLELAAADRKMPPSHLWLMAGVGRLDKRYLIFGNRPPPWPEPERPEFLDRWVKKAAETYRDKRLAESTPKARQQALADADGPAPAHEPTGG